MLVIIENQILSPIEVYSYYKKSRKIIIERFDNYNKRTYRNRFYILSSSGRQLISIPLKKGKNNNIPFSQVEISYDMDWVSLLTKTLRNCYGASPYFDYYYDDIISIFSSRYNFLYELNTKLKEYIFDVLDIDTPTEYSTEYIKNYNNDIVDLREKFSPKTSLNSSNLKLPKYTQVFEDRIGYFSNPSILDLVFNMGRYGIEYL